MQVTARQIAKAVSLDVTNVRRVLRRRSIPVELGKGTSGSGRKAWLIDTRHLPDDWASAVYAFMARDGASLTFEPDRTYKAAAAALKPTARLKLDARLEILTAFDRFAANTDTARTRARKAFCDAYNRRLLTPAHTPPAWVFESIPRIAWRTLFDWERRFEREGPAGVARITSGRRPGHSAFDRDTELNEWLRTHLIELPSIALPTLHKRAVDRFGEERVPSLRALQRWATSYRRDNAGQLLALQNPDAWKGRYQPAFGSHSEKVTRLNQIWEIDATPADVMTADGRRQTVVGVLDVYSRRAKVLITDHSRATAVAALLRAAIMDWGIPEVLKRDNGKDFCAAHVDRVLDALDIRAQNCPPFTPEAKPHIERFFGTLARGLYELLPGYVGHNVADRKAIESRRSFAERFGAAGDVIEVALTAKELQEKTALWIEAHYERAPHKGLGGRSPFEAATAWPHPIRTVNNERVLDHLLMEAPDTHGIRRVTKSGIRAEGATFIAPELAGLIGERVHVRL
ncbi:MAG: DDE-type integrase/transposase/recombinase, partial [Alphaproteobacteria bacterium]